MNKHIIVFGTRREYDDYRRRLIVNHEDCKILHHVPFRQHAIGFPPSDILLLYGWHVDLISKPIVVEDIKGLLCQGGTVIGDYSEIGPFLWEEFKSIEKKVKEGRKEKIEPYNRRPTVDRFQLIDFEE
jgi:hypothetical protein